MSATKIPSIGTSASRSSLAAKQVLSTTGANEKSTAKLPQLPSLSPNVEPANSGEGASKSRPTSAYKSSKDVVKQEGSIGSSNAKQSLIAKSASIALSNEQSRRTSVSGDGSLNARSSQISISNSPESSITKEDSARIHQPLTKEDSASSIRPSSTVSRRGSLSRSAQQSRAVTSFTDFLTTVDQQNAQPEIADNENAKSGKSSSNLINHPVRESSILKAPSMEEIMEVYSNAGSNSDRDSDTEKKKTAKAKDVNVDADLVTPSTASKDRRKKEKRTAPWNNQSASEETEASVVASRDSSSSSVTSHKSGREGSASQINAVKQEPYTLATRRPSMVRRISISTDAPTSAVVQPQIQAVKSASVGGFGRLSQVSIFGLQPGSSVSLAKNSDLVPNSESSTGQNLLDADGNNIDQALANLRRRRLSNASSAPEDPKLDAASTKYSIVPTESSLGSSGNNRGVQISSFLGKPETAEPADDENVMPNFPRVHGRRRTNSGDDNMSTRAIRMPSLQVPGLARQGDSISSIPGYSLGPNRNELVAPNFSGERPGESLDSVRPIRGKSVKRINSSRFCVESDSLDSYGSESQDLIPASEDNLSITAVKRASTKMRGIDNMRSLQKSENNSFDEEMEDHGDEDFSDEDDSIRAIRRKSTKQLESMASITGLLTKDSTDILSSQLSVATSSDRNPQSSHSNRSQYSIASSENRLSIPTSTGSLPRRGSITGTTKDTPSLAPVDPKTKLKSMLNSRKSLAPDSAELAALMAMAAKNGAEDTVQPLLEPRITDHNIVRRPRPVSMVQELSESTVQLFAMTPKRHPSLSNLSPQNLAGWHDLAIALKWGLRSWKAGKIAIGKRIKATNHVSAVEDAASMQSFLAEMDFTAKVQELVSVEKKTGDMIQALDKILKQRIPDYGKMSESDRFHLCRIMRLERHKKDTVLLWEEHPLSGFHIILTGKVEIFKLNKNQKLSLSVMNGGAMLGHARVKVEGATRTACAILLHDSILLVIDKDKYLYTADDSKDMNRHNVIDPRCLGLEKSCKLFSGATGSAFSKLAIFFDYQVYEKGEIIQAQDKRIDFLYFILKGSCGVTRSLPFIVKTQYEKSTMVACADPASFVPIPKTKELQYEEKLTWVTLSTQENLGTYDYFSHLPIKEGAPLLSSSEKPIHTALEQDKESIYRYRLLRGSDYTITAASDNCLLARIAMEDLMDIASAPLLRALLETCPLVRYSMAELQDQYLQDRAWEKMKKNTVDGVFGQIRNDQAETKKKLQREGVMRAASFLQK